MIFETSFLCLECGKPYTSDNDNDDNMYSFVKTTNNVWCNVCSVKYMQENLCTWSGNEIIDNFIKEKQSKTDRLKDFFEWIPYNKFENIEKTEKGEFYSGEWKDGYLKSYNEKNHKICRHGKLKVALKCLKNCKNPDDILNEVYNSNNCYYIYIILYLI